MKKFKVLDDKALQKLFDDVVRYWNSLPQEERFDVMLRFYLKKHSRTFKRLFDLFDK